MPIRIKTTTNNSNIIGMKTFLKTCILILIFNVNPNCFSQVLFHYDENGNRDSRILILGKANDTIQQEKDDKSYFNQVLTLSDSLNDVKILLFPNPNSGSFSIQIDGMNKEEALYFSLYSISGGLLIENNLLTSYNEIDMSQNPSGTYVLKIRKGVTEKIWKILKK